MQTDVDLGIFLSSLSPIQRVSPRWSRLAKLDSFECWQHSMYGKFLLNLVAFGPLTDVSAIEGGSSPVS